MIPIEGRPILTAAQMRAAEARAVADGGSTAALMERAGAEIAAAVQRLAAGAETLFLCGPGNNGGDGYVAARVLAAGGHRVRVAALGAPRDEAAMGARAGWTGAVEAFPDLLPSEPVHAPVVVDAVFGTGLNRAVDGHIMATVAGLVGRARLSVAVDLPTGVAGDTGEELNRLQVPGFDVTLALGALKPAHVLQPAAGACGSVRLLDIGLDRLGSAQGAVSMVETIRRPRLSPPGALSHKYSRGMVAVVAGRMHGASELAAEAAYRAGAGYVLLLTGGLPQPPHAIVRRGWAADALDDSRIGAVVVGPGLGRDERAREKLAAALESDRPVVVDGDALHLLDLDTVRGRRAATILTPHAGEFAALFGEGEGSKIDRASAAARRSGAIVVHKGPDTVIADPSGQAIVSTHAVPWLATAGTGDVLAGTIAAMLAQAQDPLGAASAGVWLHGEAARRVGRSFIADDLVVALSDAVAAATAR